MTEAKKPQDEITYLKKIIKKLNQQDKNSILRSIFMLLDIHREWAAIETIRFHQHSLENEEVCALFVERSGGNPEGNHYRIIVEKVDWTVAENGGEYDERQQTIDE